MYLGHGTRSRAANKDTGIVAEQSPTVGTSRKRQQSRLD